MLENNVLDNQTSAYFKVHLTTQDRLHEQDIHPKGIFFLTLSDFLSCFPRSHCPTFAGKLTFVLKLLVYNLLSRHFLSLFVQ